MPINERPEQQQDKRQEPQPSEQPFQLEDLAAKPVEKPEQKEVKGGGQYGWYGNDYA